MLEGTSREHQVKFKAASTSILLRVVCSWVLNTFKYIDFTASADLLHEFVSLTYTFLLHGFRQQQDAAKAFWRLNKPKPSSLSTPCALSCGSSGELSAGITLLYQCLPCTGEPRIGLVVWSVAVTAHSVSCCAADKLLPKVFLMPSSLHKISQSWSCQLWQSLVQHKHHPKIRMNSFLLFQVLFWFPWGHRLARSSMWDLELCQIQANMRLYPKISGAKKELFKLSAVGETIIFTLVIELIPVKSLCVKAGRDEMDEEVEKVEMVNRGFLYLGFFLDKKYNSIIEVKEDRLCSGSVIGVKWETARGEENWIHGVNWINREQNSIFSINVYV